MGKQPSRADLMRGVWNALAEVGAARPVQGEWWPLKHAREGMSYGEWTRDAVDELLQTRLTREQLELLARVIYRVGVSVTK